MKRYIFLIIMPVLLLGCSWESASPDRIELCKNATDGVFCQKAEKNIKESVLSCRQVAGRIYCDDDKVQQLADPQEQSAIDIEMGKNRSKRNFPDLFNLLN